MDTKYELGFSKSIEGSRWKHLVSVWFDMSEDYTDNINTTVYQDLATRYKVVRQDFLKFMRKNYGPQDGVWSVRWTDYGVDIRFDNTSDAGRFIMCYTKPSNLNEMGKFYRENGAYSGIRGH